MQQWHAKARCTVTVTASNHRLTVEGLGGAEAGWHHSMPVPLELVMCRQGCFLINKTAFRTKKRMCDFQSESSTVGMGHWLLVT